MTCWWIGDNARYFGVLLCTFPPTSTGSRGDVSRYHFYQLAVAVFCQLVPVIVIEHL